MSKPEKTKQRRETKTKQKELAIWVYYQGLVSSLGKRAANLSIFSIYDEVSIPFFVNKEAVGAVVRKCLRDPKMNEIKPSPGLIERIKLINDIIERPEENICTK